jgi:hypothetical protein
MSGVLSFFGKMTMILLPGETWEGAMSPEKQTS